MKKKTVPVHQCLNYGETVTVGELYRRWTGESGYWWELDMFSRQLAHDKFLTVDRLTAPYTVTRTRKTFSEKILKKT